MRFVDDRGTLLHVVRDGSGGPVVLFVQGLAGAWFEWDPVVPMLAGDHRLVRFDRPGLGWSQPELGADGRPLPQTLAGEAERLGRVLDAVGVPPREKVILVAHSYGAFHAEAFARLDPERVAGIVFVDASAESDITPAPGGPGRAAGRAFVRGTTLLGLNQVLGPAVRRLVYQAASTTHRDPDRELGRAVYRSSRVAAAVVNELSSYRACAVELLELRCERAFPEVLVQVLVGAAGESENRHVRRWIERQREFAGLFPGAEVVELPDAKHLIAADRPDAVATGVRSLGF
ncbi:alpha/beta hydrolase [Catenulispora sp. NF23]|uniref:Alpha/beta hydrolase n=1 Tax=Catenulispora pinistramenti TaxID=2705254 RepID=A0ABS5KI75_9ACTN|nr:alpha/beta hydrolase [Catenulispora pinistramenti]MBS2532322.1 alpha/beta hydrolase [Catenulispora pinistramenti]MBS2546091.1 alpha/beta hydrolase [Catenulispora pinistramenti]